MCSKNNLNTQRSYNLWLNVLIGGTLKSSLLIRTVSDDERLFVKQTVIFLKSAYYSLYMLAFRYSKPIVKRIGSKSLFWIFTITRRRRMETSSKANFSTEMLDLLESKRFVSTKKMRKVKENPVKVEYESTDALISTTCESNSNSKGFDEKAPPDPIKNFASTYEAIKQMRSARNAPVDLEGMHKPDPNVDEDTQHFQVMVSLILSVQTKDQTTALVMNRLRAEKLSVDTMIEMDSSKLKELIFEANFNNNKVKYIKALAQELKENYNSKLPRTVQELLKLPGIGPKIAYLYLQMVFQENQGIAVDTHVHRISNRLGWVKNTKVPEQTRAELEKIVPVDLWAEINELLVGFGQQICLPIGPRCEACLVNKVCPEGIKNMKRVDKITVKKEVKKVKRNGDAVEVKIEKSELSIAAEKTKLDDVKEEDDDVKKEEEDVKKEDGEKTVNEKYIKTRSKSAIMSFIRSKSQQQGKKHIPLFLFTFCISLFNHNPLSTMQLYCLLYTSPSPRDGLLSRMPSSA
eukprot:TRINITY_DN10081_c0_g1_i3.p1 TRINITY_DN10081_c0_g1~~TRINITY_DN10081_c0_g1_i3.p1  ORF type:complete len:518 (-),score=76.07 TRINITY_DN10081_c0_g1_i3:12-1565(-)